MTGLEMLRAIADNLNKGTFTLASLSRDIQESLEQVEREQADDREIAEWVREHGGIEHVRDIWDEMVNLCATIGCEPDIVTDAIEALGECTDIVNKRLMPPGMEWPRFEDGNPVRFGDEIEHKEDGHRFTVGVIEIMSDGWRAAAQEGGVRDVFRPGERVRRPKQYPIGADGLPIKRGDTVYDNNSGDRLIVGAIEDCGDTITCRYADLEDSAIPTHGSWSPCDLTHRAPVIATDGKPLSGGETVWGVNGATYRVTDVHDGKVFARHIRGSFGAEVKSAGGSGVYLLRAEQLTHERPDSWEQLEKDSKENPFDYCKKVGHHLFTFDNAEEFKSADLVRRAKALAERDKE